MNWWAKLKLRWRLAMHGEDAILNAIDAIHGAGYQLGTDGEFVDAEGALYFHRIAIAHLTRLIDYEAEPEPVYPDDAMELADGAMPPIPAGYALHAPIYIEDDGIEHVVPQNFRQQEIA